MITYKTIDKDTIKKITHKEDIIDLKVLRIELESLEKELKDLEKEPDEITVPNDEKLFRVESIEVKKKEINNLLKE
jgi:hypothetical protein